jgi:hypothetical protein
VTIDERVAAGMALLDREVPGWVDRIDLDRLDMAAAGYSLSPGKECGCILAQIDATEQPAGIGDYFDGRDRLALGVDYWELSDWSIDHGFNASGESYRDLTEAWRRVILARRAAVTS